MTGDSNKHLHVCECMHTLVVAAVRTLDSGEIKKRVSCGLELTDVVPINCRAERRTSSEDVLWHFQ